MPRARSNSVQPVIRRPPLIIGCAIYCVGLLLFILFPFDFVLSLDDWRNRIGVLPSIMLSWPGEGRPAALGLVLVLVDTAATVPLGMLLALRSRRRSLLGMVAAGDGQAIDIQ